MIAAAPEHEGQRDADAFGRHPLFSRLVRARLPHIFRAQISPHARRHSRESGDAMHDAQPVAERSRRADATAIDVLPITVSRRAILAQGVIGHTAES